MQAFEHATYSFEDSGHRTYHGVNSSQRLTLDFNGQEARLSHPDGTLNLHLNGYGYGARLMKPARAVLTASGNRLEYQRGDLTEWYLNGPQGLEQGFSLARRPPPDGAVREGEPLVIALGVTGGLVPTQKTDAESVLFESSEGTVLRYAGLRALDARDRVLPSRFEVRGREVRLIVDDRDALYPLVIDPTWTQQQQLTASDGVAQGGFGSSISVSGDTALIGAPYRNSFEGAVYVFVRTGGVWSQQQKLTASDGAANDEFGWSVSVSGDTAVIGAYRKYGLHGAVYVFLRSAGIWSQQQQLATADGAVGDGEEFGYSVSISGDTVVAGAIGKTIGSTINLGAAYVFVRSSGVWGQQQELTASDAAKEDAFGYSVSVSGDMAVIGAAYKTIGSNAEQGAAYVFARSAGVWSQQQELTAADGSANDFLGDGVSASGDTALIGAYGWNGYQGAAYVFVLNGGAWSQQQELTASDGVANDNFGYSVSVSGDTAVIGALDKAIASHGAQGAGYVFARGAGAWSQQQELTASDGATSWYFGSSVSVSGDTAVIGAYGALSFQGAGYAFVRPRLGTDSLSVGSGAGSSSVVLSYSGAWTATANDSFLHLSAGSFTGTGSAVVVFTFDQFLDTGTRTGTLTIAGLTLTVTQAGTDYIGPGPVTTLVSGLGMARGVAVDGSGNVYIADTSNNLIKKWNASTQQLSTLVSSGLNGPFGVAVDGAGNVYIADTYNSAIKLWSASTQQVITLVESGLQNPYGVAVDAFGNVYIADSGDQLVKEWSASTQELTVLASFNNPQGIAVDRSGNVYINDNNNAIYELSQSTQQVVTLVSSGLNYIQELAVDGAGNVYAADAGNGAVYEWSASTQEITTLASLGLNNPYGVAVDGAGNVYIADTYNSAIKEIPHAFTGPASLGEPAEAGMDALLPLIPSAESLTGIFGPSSDQSWLTIGTITDGVVNFSFTANMSGAARVAHITVLGQPTTVTQSAPLLGQTITFGALSDQQFGNAPFKVSAAASSGLPVSFNSQTSSVCTVLGATVTLVATGTCTIEATQPGDNTTYAAATIVNESFQVTQAMQSQAISFGALSNQSLGAAPFMVSATATSGLPVSFASTTASVCTVSSAMVTLVSVGQCTIQATQVGNVAYAAAAPVNQSFQVTQPTLVSIAVTPSNPSISFGQIEQFAATGTYTDGSMQNLTSSATWTSSATGVATINNAGLAASVGIGPTTISAMSSSGPSGCIVPPPGMVSWWPGDGNTNDLMGGNNGTIAGGVTFVPGEVAQAFSVDGGPGGSGVSVGNSANLQLQTFTIDAWIRRGSTLLASNTFGGGPIFAYGFGGYSLVLFDDGRLLMSQVGLGSIATPGPVVTDTAFHHVAVTYSNAGTGQTTFFVDGSAVFTDTTYNPTFFFNTNAAVGLTGATNSFLGVIDEPQIYSRVLTGAEIQAIFAAGSTGQCKPVAGSTALTVTSTSQAISFGALSNQSLGAAPFMVSATATSGLPVSFASTTASVCTVSSAMVTLVSVGQCTIQATQVGNVAYAAAAPVNQSFQVTQPTLVSIAVTPSNPSISFGQIEQFAATGTYTDGSMQNLTSSATWTSSATGVATINNAGLAASVGIGPTTISAMSSSGPSGCIVPPPGMVSWWPGDGNTNDLMGGNNGTIAGGVTFVPGEVAQAFSVDGGPGGSGVSVGNSANLQLQTFTIDAWIRRGSTLLASNTFGGGPIFAYGFGGYSLVLFDDGRLLMSQVGLGSIATPGPVVTDTAFHHVAVTYSNAGTGQTTFFVDGSAVFTDTTYNPTFFFNTNAAVGLTGATNSFLGVIDEPQIYSRVLTGAEIQAIFAAGSTGQCKPVAGSTALTVTSTSQAISFGALSNQSLGAAPFMVSATATSGLPVSFASTTASVCTVSGASVTLVAVGVCTIQATQAGNTKYAHAVSVNQSFQVTQSSQTIAFGTLSNRMFGTPLFTIGATATSGLPVSFASTTMPVCTVSNTTVTLVAVGTCTIQATQPGNTNYTAAASVNQSFQVTQGSQTIAFGVLSNQAFGAPPFTVSATASPRALP